MDRLSTSLIHCLDSENELLRCRVMQLEKALRAILRDTIDARDYSGDYWLSDESRESACSALGIALNSHRESIE
jgi:hypothetical protein